MDKYSVERTSIDNAWRAGKDVLPAVADSASPNHFNIPVIRQIECNAETRPDKVAITYKGAEITYARLMKSVYQLAAGLKDMGVGSGSRVVVLMHPCPDLVTSLLATHQLGATYVPVDPNFPPARVGMILEDVAPVAILVPDADRLEIDKIIPEAFSTRLYSFSSVLGLGEAQSHPFQAYPLTLADESHIFFTSGTTGRPKGALSSQLNLAHGMSSSAQCFELTSSHSILSVAGASFSISTFELLSLLALGGSVSIAERSEILEIEKLFAVASRVSVWHFVPTLLARLIEFVESEPHRISSIRHLERILTGGDNVPPSLLCKIRKILPWVKLYVNYGASETNCMVTYWPVAATMPEKTKIGGPQKNVKLMVLDKSRQIVADGDVGELFVSSPGVIPGYMHREDLNREKFIELDGRRYFATGDMVRSDKEGLYEMLGREDFQIQLNGNRIELLEVESAIKQVSGIKDCVVAAKHLNEGDSSATLVAYVVPDVETPLSVTTIKSFLNSILPAYMVPSLYLQLESVPTNHNGKVDRINLPQPRNCRILQSNDEEPLVNAMEHRVSEIWRELLGVESIHANSQFFELGGDSISAVRLIAKITTELQADLSIADIVNNATVRQQSALISDRLFAAGESGANVSHRDSGYLLLKSGHRDMSPLLLINGVVEYLELAKALSTDRPVYAIYLPEELDLIMHGAESQAATTTDTLGGITLLYLSVIASLQPKGPYYLAGKSFGGIIAIEVGRELEKLGHEVAFTGLLDTVTPEAFTAHRKLSFRARQHIKHMLDQGPGYLMSRVKQRYSQFYRKETGRHTVCSSNSGDLKNIQVRHQVRKNAIFTTRLSRIHRPIVLIKARDRQHLYGEKPSDDLGWRKYCANLTTYEVPGDHHSILMPGQADNVARYLESHI